MPNAKCVWCGERDRDDNSELFCAECIKSSFERSYWLAFDIGCIECGETSDVIGVFTTKEEAESAVKAAEEEQQKNWTGQHHMDVFEIKVPILVNLCQ